MRNTSKSVRQSRGHPKSAKPAVSKPGSPGAGTLYVHSGAALLPAGKNANSRTSPAGKSASASNFVPLRIDKRLLAELNVDRTTQLVGSVENGTLVIRPTRRIGMKEANKLATEIKREYDEALRKLAQ